MKMFSISEIIILSTLLLYAQTGASQKNNLVSNSSFDRIASDIPKRCCGEKGMFNKSIEDWYTFGGLYEGTPDIICPHTEAFKWFYKSGNNANNTCIGILTLCEPFSEFVSTKLIKSIQPNKYYKIAIRINASPINPYSNRKQEPLNLEKYFGFYFTSDREPSLKLLYKSKPQIVFTSWVVPGKWKELTAVYKPDSVYSYLHIGSFCKDSQNYLYYYLLDDISICEINEDQIAIEEIENISEESLIFYDSGAIFFNTNKFDLSDTSITTLNALYNYLSEINEDFTIILNGHADSVGSEKSNLHLSKKRAEKVAGFLMQKGVDKSHIRVNALGSIWAKPNDADLQMNRRVDWSVEKIYADEFNYDSIKYLFSEEIEKGSLSDKDIRYSFIGEYKKSIFKHDFGRPSEKNTLSEDSLLLNKSYPVPAINYILSCAKNAKLIMLNEAHYLPEHRAFATQLLGRLFSLGYRTLAVEMLAEESLQLMERGYPSVNSGYFFPEPYLGDLVRLAIKTGFTVVGYEAQQEETARVRDSLFQEAVRLGKTDISSNDPILSMNARDYIQARNLQKILSNSNNGKIVVYSGFGHIREKKYANWLSLACNLKKLSKIDPLTVDQVRATLIYNLYNKRVEAIQQPTIFLDSTSKTPFVAKEYDLLANSYISQQYDIQVLHPNNDGWQSVGGYRKLNDINEIVKPFKNKCPCLVYFWHAYEDEKNATPVMVKEIHGDDRGTSVFLPTGEYTVIIQDNKRNILPKIKYKSK